MCDCVIREDENFELDLNMFELDHLQELYFCLCFELKDKTVFKKCYITNSRKIKYVISITHAHAQLQISKFKPFSDKSKVSSFN